MKVYVAMNCDYGDQWVVGVFTKRESAELAAQAEAVKHEPDVKCGWSVDECELDGHIPQIVSMVKPQ